MLSYNSYTMNWVLKLERTNSQLCDREVFSIHYKPTSAHITYLNSQQTLLRTQHSLDLSVSSLDVQTIQQTCKITLIND